MRAQRRSSTTSCARCARASCRRRAAFSAPATAPASCCSSTSASPARRSLSAMARPAAATSSPASSPYSRAFAGALVFSKEFSDIAFGMSALPFPARRPAGQARLGPRGRDRADGPPDQRGFSPSAASSRSAGSSSTRATARPRVRSSAATASCTATSRPARRFANALDFQDQLDRWCERINARVHRIDARGRRRAPRRGAASACARCRAMPDTDRRFVTRVPAQPYLRFDRNDYSLDPRLVGRRVEVASEPG